VILLAGGGFLVERFLAVPGAFAVGVIAGLLVAPLVPAPVACGIPGHRPDPRRGAGSSEGADRSADDPGPDAAAESPGGARAETDDAGDASRGGAHPPARSR